MSRSKKIFVAFAILFFLFLAYVAYDISTRTTFPGSRPAGVETSPKSDQDSIPSDTTRLR